jgi:hypothetical protein
MRQWVTGVSVTAMFGMAIVAAAPPETQPVTIRGCVRAGTEPNSFMLMDVTEVRPGQLREQPVPTDAQGRDVLYWLSSPKGLKKEIGQRVEVKGTLDPDRPKRGETKVAEDSSKRLDLKNEIKSGGKAVTVKTDSQPTATSDTAVKTSVKEPDRVLYRVKVTSVRGVEGTCQ